MATIAEILDSIDRRCRARRRPDKPAWAPTEFKNSTRRRNGGKKPLTKSVYTAARKGDPVAQAHLAERKARIALYALRASAKLPLFEGIRR